MNSNNTSEDKEISFQRSVFSKWINEQLKASNGKQINDLRKDLSDGVSLIELALALTKKKAPRPWKKNPVRNVDKVQNCDLAIQIFNENGAKIFGISGKDINDNNDKLILGLVWSLISHYSINHSIQVSENKENMQKASHSNQSYKKALIEWVNERIKGYKNVEYFKPYDLAICALIDSYVPDKIHFKELVSDDIEKNVQIANKAMESLGIPVYINPDDVLNNGNNVDEKILLTQLSTAKIVLDSLNIKGENVDDSKQEDDNLYQNDVKNNNTNSNQIDESSSIKKNDVYCSDEREEKIRKELKEIIKSSLCLSNDDDLSDQKNLYLMLYDCFYGKSNQKFEYIYYEWSASDNGRKYDISKIEQNGIKKSDLSKISKIARKLYNQIYLPFHDIKKSITNLSYLYYKDQINSIEETCNQLKSIYDECDSILKNEPLLVHSEVENAENAILELSNPYPLIKQLIDDMKVFIEEIQSTNQKIPMDNFIFTKQFQLLSTFQDDIENKGLTSDEIHELLTVWSILMRKGFALNQIKIKNTIFEFNELAKENDEEEDESNIDEQLLSEYNNLWKYFDVIYNNSSKLNEESLKQIYDKHKNDESSSIIKPFLDKILPYYKSLDSPKGFVRLTVDGTITYKSILKKYCQIDEAKRYNYTFDSIPLFPIYLDMIPFKLIDPPDDSYYSLIKIFIANYKIKFSNIPLELMFKTVYESQTVELGTNNIFCNLNLNTQKYYLAWFLMMSTIYTKKIQRLSFPDSIMIFLLLPWVIDDDSDEARRIEEYFKDTMKKVLESDIYVKYKETEDTDDFSCFLKGDYEIVNFVDDVKFVDVFIFLFWRKYFIEKVFPAEKELDRKKMKSHMKKIIKKDKIRTYPTL